MDNYTATELAYKNGYESGLDKMQSIIDAVYHQQMTDIENGICKAVLDVGINVDKERLTRAIEDARSFYAEGYKRGKKDALKEQEECAKNAHWISVKEWLPETHGCFLTFGPQRKWETLYYNDEEDVWEDDADWDIEVTHWMPLPEPPKEEA